MPALVDGGARSLLVDGAYSLVSSLLNVDPVEQAVGYVDTRWVVAHTSAVSTPSDRLPASPFGGDGEMARRMRSFDWSTTPLGPIESWSTSLRTAVGICLRARFPCWCGGVQTS